MHSKLLSSTSVCKRAFHKTTAPVGSRPSCHPHLVALVPSWKIKVVVGAVMQREMYKIYRRQKSVWGVCKCKRETISLSHLTFDNDGGWQHIAGKAT